MAESSLILVHGLYHSGEAKISGGAGSAREQREKAFKEHGEALGVRHYEWVNGRNKPLANRMLRLVRGTVRAVDAVEIIELDEATLHASLADETARARWHAMASCAPYGLDAARSFILMGAPRKLLESSASGQRVLWFGNGLNHLSEAGFVSHYTGRHGPLVAGHAQLIGLEQYRQVPNEQDALCDSLRLLGLGQAVAPAVFAELVMVRPPPDLASLRARRAAKREIKADEKCHIDFHRSMLFLV